MKKLSIVTPCFNEEENVQELCEVVRGIMGRMPQLDYEHIIIDNCSNDATVAIAKGIASVDKRVKIIVNSRNFGHIRSPFYGLLQATGDAAILMASDFQDPPELIPKFVEQWEAGEKIVIGRKTTSEESRIMYGLRKLYYRTVDKLSEMPLVENFTGFGLYDRQILDLLRSIDDPYPYFRGLICELGFHRAEIEFTQPRRKRGKTKNNFLTLFDMGILGITYHSKAPIRFATLGGFAIAALSFLAMLYYLIMKLVHWNDFSAGTAPLLIGMFFLSSLQLFFIGIIGEYVGSVYTQVLHRPLVIEKERVNFENKDCDRANEK